MELYAKGQLSFLILTCMQDRDFYGLDIISEISERSNGRINLKKPSVYSNLTRMEKQGYISSYLRSSDFGPNRKYYSLTEKGREFYQELKDYFERNKIDVFKDFNDGAVQNTSPIQNMSFFTKSTDNEGSSSLVEEETINDEKEESQSEEDFFDFSFASEEKKGIEPDAEDEPVEEAHLVNEDIEKEDSPLASAAPAANNYSIKQALLQQTEEQKAVQEEVHTNGGVFLSQESADEYNKRIYDISKDINKYRKKRSFAEDQISMTNTNALAISQEKKQSNLEEFKNALLINKTKYNERINQEDFERQMGYRYDRQSISENKQEQKKEEIKNDAVFITNRISENDIEKARKIEPPQLKIITEISKDNKLPAPKRDATIDPSHKEILSNLYSRTRDNSAEEIRDDAIYDYNDLKDYYNNQDIDFSIYKKPTRKIKHNTNKLYLIVSLITLLGAVALSAVSFMIVSLLGMINPSTTCLYWILPCIFVVDVVWKACKYKQSNGWLPHKIMPQWAIWLIYLALSGAVFGMNFIFGFAPALFGVYATTIILPLAMAVIIVPFRYYVTRIAIIKFWR